VGCSIKPRKKGLGTLSAVEVNLLGLGAVRLRNEQTVVYVDAFSELVRPQLVEKVNLILVTHADGDHFEPHETAHAALETGAIVVGPPSIAYPLLANTRLPARQLHIIYPIHFKRPVKEEIGDVRLKVYQTKHFNDWEPDHISYLVELGGQRFYVTGDSSMLDETDPDLQGVDGMIYSMVMDTVAAGAVDAHLAALEKVQRGFSPRYIVPNHLLYCNWAIKPLVLQNAVRRRGLEGIIIVENETQVIEIVPLNLG
jgi:L-ascorbate metabolism protein UlaG (beta-lactamase superfamily)